jgi:hypothetical protein
MQLSEVDTIQDLKEWAKENMPTARIEEDENGILLINTGLIATMGGYLHDMREGE